MKINKTENLHKHIKGSYKDYDPEVHKNAIYFAEDEEQIIIDGIEYGGSNYWYDVKEREKFLVYEITTEETDNVEFVDFYKMLQLGNEELPEKSEYFIDWGDGNTEIFKSNTDDIPQEVIDIIQEGEYDDLKDIFNLIDGFLLSHKYKDKKEYNIKIYIYNPNLYKNYSLDYYDIYSYPNSALINLNCKPTLIKHYGINNKLFPVTFNAYNIECNPQLILDNEITEILDSSLGQYTFTGELKLPDNLTSIGDNAFNYCSGFTGELNIPSGVTSIGNYAFGSCSGFTGDLNIPDSVTSIGGNAFYECSGFIGELKLPETLTSIKGRAFSGCSGFTKIYVCEDTILAEHWNADTPAEVIKYKKGETPWLNK